MATARTYSEIQTIPLDDRNVDGLSADPAPATGTEDRSCRHCRIPIRGRRRDGFCSDRCRMVSAATRGGGGRLPQGFFTPAEIAAYIGMSTYTVQDLCRRGELRHVKAGRSIRIRREWADQY